MNPIHNTPVIKQTPTNNPELLEIWKTMYNELIEVYNKSRAMEIIGARYGVSRPTVIYHLFPEYKKYQKNCPSKKWSYEKSNPAIHKRVTDYKRKYIHVRRHIDEFIKESYQKSMPQEPMTIENLAYAIHDISGVFFKPDTIMGLVNKYEQKKGYPLLSKVPGFQTPHFSLNEF